MLKRYYESPGGSTDDKYAPDQDEDETEAHGVVAEVIAESSEVGQLSSPVF